MWRELIRIPTGAPISFGPLGAWPLFGGGVLLALWVLYGAWQLVRRFAKPASPKNPAPSKSTGAVGAADEPPADDLFNVIFWGVVALGIWKAPDLAPTGLPVFGYGFSMFVGIVAACWLTSLRAPKYGYSTEIAWDLAGWLVVPGVIGARAMFLGLHGRDMFRGLTFGESLQAAVDLSRGGLVLYGGLLAGAVGYFLYCHRHKLHPLDLADLVMPAVFVGIGFGRIGCLLNGCCFGDVSNLPWAVSFPQASAAWETMFSQGFLLPDEPCTPRLQPTQIYSAIDGFLLAALTAAQMRFRNRRGEVFALSLITYPITRFLIESLRGDENHFVLTNSQWISLAMILTGVVLAAMVTRFGGPVRSPDVLHLPTVGPA